MSSFLYVCTSGTTVSKREVKCDIFLTSLFYDLFKEKKPNNYFYSLGFLSIDIQFF